MTKTVDFFRARLDAVIDLRHPLAVLTTRLPSSQLEAERPPRSGSLNRATACFPKAKIGLVRLVFWLRLVWFMPAVRDYRSGSCVLFCCTANTLSI